MSILESTGRQIHRLPMPCNRLIGTIPDDTTIYMKFRFYDYSNTGGVNTRAAVNIPDSVAIPNGVSYFEIPYTINHIPEDQNGGLAAIRGYIRNPNGSENSGQTDYVNIFSRFTYEYDFQKPAPLFTVFFRLNLKDASPHVICSVDGGFTWDKPKTEYTGADLSKIMETGVFYIKEPNSCHLATISVGKKEEEQIPPSAIKRQMNIPYTTNAIISHTGTFYIASGQNFTFNITPTGTNAGLVPVITTNRTSIPDSEGVKIEDNKDGSYTVTILSVQQSININIDFATTNEAIEGDHKVWTDNKLLYISSTLNSTAFVYNTVGALIKTVVLSADQTASLTLPEGLYIVKLGNKTYKVVLK